MENEFFVKLGAAMNNLPLWILISLIFSIVIWSLAIRGLQGKKYVIGDLTVPLFFLFAFVLRVVVASSFGGFEVDVNCFSAWSDRMATMGPAHFYAEDYFSDYPPLYLYFLYVIGVLKKAFGLLNLSPLHLVLLKSPAIISDVLIGFLIYKVGVKRIGLAPALLLSALYLFQPVIILNSCLWGQVDSVFTLFLIVCCLFLEKLRLLPAMIVFGLGVLLKPQMLIFSPLLILGFIHYVYRGSFSFRMLSKAIAYGALTLVMTVLIAMPFGLENVLSRYFDTLGSYPHASVNAYNFWAGVGLNWYPQTTKFMGIPCQTWGYVAIVLAASFSLILGLRLRTLTQKYFITGAFLILTVFTFSVRMHERYLYPIIPLMIFGFMGFASRQICYVPSAKTEKNDDRQVYPLTPTLRFLFPAVFIAISILHYVNVAHVLYYYDPSNYNASAPILKITGILTTVAALCFYYLMIRLQSPKEMPALPEEKAFRESVSPIRILDSEMRMSKLDVILVIVITLFYSCFALRDLGDNKAPQTLYETTSGVSMTFEFPKEVTAVSYYEAPWHEQRYAFQCETNDEVQPVAAQLLIFDTVFCWKTLDLPAATTKVTMTPQNAEARLLELVFLDSEGNPVSPVNASEYPALFDEANVYPEKFSFRNSTYFDEIYHARTAYEFLHGWYSYENTHPPLGKILISIGITIFGMNPFGWRIIGTLFGIAMLPITYVFAKRLTGDTPAAALTCWIFAFDFMHFAQTRIATIDVYIVFFILCMYYFLFKYLSSDFTATPLKKLLLALGLCGLSMGLGVASKWTGVYAGIGMGILFFLHLGRVILKTSGATSFREVKPFKTKYFRSDAGKRILKIVGCCIIFFVVIPVIIYVLSYIPFRDSWGNGLIKRAIKNQETMFSYHSTLEATHYFASPFYEWPFIVRPIWYYSLKLSDTLREGISSFGNPFVWWAGLPALVYVTYLFIRKKDRRALFLIIGYLSQYLPWVLVTRLTFIYHYFPSVVFLVLMIGYSFRNLKEVLSKKAYLTILITYGVLVFGLFCLFYPVLAGQPVELEFAEKYLKWFKTWILVAGK